MRRAVRGSGALQPENLKYSDIHPNDSIQSIIRNVCQNNIRTLEHSASVLDPAEMERAVQAIVKAKRVDSLRRGQLGARRATTRRTNSCSIRCRGDVGSPYADTLAAGLTKDDVAVLISYSGESRDIRYAQRRPRDRSHRDRHRYGPNRLSKLVDIRLQTSSTESFVRAAR